MKLSQIETAEKLVSDLKSEFKVFDYKRKIIKECEERLSLNSTPFICLSNAGGYNSNSLIVKKETMMAIVALMKNEVGMDEKALEITVDDFKKQAQDGFK